MNNSRIGLSWDLREFLDLDRVELSTLVTGAFEPRDFVIVADTNDADAFTESNPKYYMSALLGLPFRYVDPVDVAPRVLALGALRLPQGLERLKLSVLPWSRTAVDSAQLFSQLFVADPARSTPVVQFVVSGVAEEQP